MWGSRPNPGCGCVQAVQWRMVRRRFGNSGGGFYIEGGRDRAQGDLLVQRVSRTKARVSVNMGVWDTGRLAAVADASPASARVWSWRPNSRVLMCGGHGMGDGRDRLLTLRFPTQVGAYGLEVGLDLSAVQAPGHDRKGPALSLDLTVVALRGRRSGQAFTVG